MAENEDFDEKELEREAQAAPLPDDAGPDMGEPSHKGSQVFAWVVIIVLAGLIALGLWYAFGGPGGTTTSQP